MQKELLTRYIFFFSSRRRHTRLQGDWSSDVCSSDLKHGTLGAQILPRACCGRSRDARRPAGRISSGPVQQFPRHGPLRRRSRAAARAKIGRASCRERGEISVVAVSFKKKKKDKYVDR